jgi:ABC-type nitrate/sulfonate/bicarbonate transport system substrate-binding protein
MANQQSRADFGAPLRPLWSFEDAMEMKDVVLAVTGIAMEDTITKKPEALRRYVHAIVKSHQWGWKDDANRAEVKRLIVKWTGLPADAADAMTLPPGSLNGKFPAGQLRKIQELMIQTGLLKVEKLFSDDELFETRFLPS